MFVVHISKKKDIVSLGLPEKFAELGITTYTDLVSIENVFEKIYEFLNSPSTVAENCVHTFRDEAQEEDYNTWVATVKRPNPIFTGEDIPEEEL